MVKGRLSSDDYSENKPQFFKIYFPQHCSHRLRIPPAFTKYFNGASISRAVLKTSHSKTSSLSWCVDVNKINGHHFFENGWPEFVQENSLKSEEFLVFCYNGESEFYVAIFGKNAIRKEFAYINTKCHDEHQSVLQGTQTDEQRKSNERRKKQEREKISERTVEENSEDSSSSQFITNNPFFSITLPASYVNKGYLNIPSTFERSYMYKFRETARLQRSNKCWDVTLVKNPRKGYSFCGGWPKFAKENNLKVRDKCIFELINMRSYVFNVVLRGKSKERASKRKRSRVDTNIESGSSSEIISDHPFFRVTMSSTYINKCYLNIDRNFQNKYMNKHHATVRLERKNKRWKVNLKGYTKRPNFCGGWDKFADENNLQVGDVCLFKLINTNNYVFDVSIDRGKPKERKSQQKRGEISKRRRVDTNIESASSSEIKSKLSNHPYFKITMFPTYVSKGFLNIKSGFHEKYMLAYNATATLKRNNKSWDVNLMGFQNRALKFCGGWNIFANDNNLQLGDVCHFELIDMNNYVFNVLIDRARTHGK